MAVAHGWRQPARLNALAWAAALPFAGVSSALLVAQPVVITVGFIGCLVAGWPGGCVAALAAFLPCDVLTVGPAPYFKKVQGAWIILAAALLGVVLYPLRH